MSVQRGPKQKKAQHTVKHTKASKSVHNQQNVHMHTENLFLASIYRVYILPNSPFSNTHQQESNA